VGRGGPVDQLLGLEPEGDLLLRRLCRVRPVDDVSSQIDAKVPANGSRERLLRVGFAHHHATGFGGVFALPHHRDDGSGGDEIDEFVVKRLVLQVDVVLLNVLSGSLHKFHSDELEPSLLESLDDVTDESSLYSVGFHHDESAVGVRHDDSRRKGRVKVEHERETVVTEKC